MPPASPPEPPPASRWPLAVAAAVAVLVIAVVGWSLASQDEGTDVAAGALTEEPELPSGTGSTRRTTTTVGEGSPADDCLPPAEGESASEHCPLPDDGAQGEPLPDGATPSTTVAGGRPSTTVGSGGGPTSTIGGGPTTISTTTTTTTAPAPTTTTTAPTTTTTIGTGRVQGQMRWANGDPAPGTIQFHPDPNGTFKQITTDGSGSFSVDLVPGTYHVLGKLSPNKSCDAGNVTVSGGATATKIVTC